MIYIHETISALREMSADDHLVADGYQAKVRRAAIGVMLALGPFNYPVS
jgi:acyl-CoA reductase-like NAD-dependent aldehyde dehydrogenase